MQNPIRSLSSILLLYLLCPTACVPSGDQKEPEKSGELQRRIDMSVDRLLHGQIPAFTDPFILADVALLPEYPRRFSNYSGDLSGRYLSAISVLPRDQHPAGLPALVDKLISYQQPDGRFGRANLAFTAREIGREHMALLWGNGRLLVGLMDYYAAYPEDQVLEAARRLGEFLLSIVEVNSQPEIAERLKSFGASGYICFTQLNEGLSLLAEETGDKRYSETAGIISLWLLPRGDQHAHGYLTTLRGLLQVYEQTGDAAQLGYVVDAYNALVQSDEYLIYGGIPEYFGSFRNTDQGAPQALRDEGCTEADFVALSFQLWSATGEMHYLEKAEHALMNHLFFNQFASGDFGHHTLRLDQNSGFQLAATTSPAWWCCTMHGLRYLIYSQNRIVTRNGDVRRINLFFDTEWEDDAIHLHFVKDPNANTPTYSISIEKAVGEITLAVRYPKYLEDMQLTLNGEPVSLALEDGYAKISREWREGDVLQISQQLRTRILTPDGRELALSDIGPESIEGYLFHGPYLLGTDESLEPEFMNEPGWGNIILVDASSPRPFYRIEPETTIPEAYLGFEYVHGGFFGRQPVTLRPISEVAYGQRVNVRVLQRFRKG